MNEYTYKPALLARRKTFHLGPDALIRCDSDGNEDWRLRWNDITGAAYVETLVKRIKLRRLDLAYGTGRKRRSIGFNGPEAADLLDPECLAHLDLCTAILERLAQRDPDFQVTVGEYGGGRIGLFVIGGSMAVFALIIGISAVSGAVPGGNLAETAIPMIVMAVLGIAISWTYAPWRKRESLPAGTVALALSRMAPSMADNPQT